MTDLQCGLVAWYPLKGNTKDNSGNENHGTKHAHPAYVTNHRGESKSALDFIQRREHVYIPDSPSLKIKTELTLSAWIKARCLHLSRIINKWEGHRSEVGAAYNLGTDRGNAIWFEVCGSTQNPKSAIFRVNVRKFLTTWQHIVGTYDGSFLRLFINGKEVKKVAWSDTINQDPVPVYIGTGDGKKFTFNGSISDVRIYNRALNHSEVKALGAFE